AFLRNSGAAGHARGRSLAALLSPMRATLEKTDQGLALQLEPMRAADAVRPWSQLQFNTDAHTLVLRPSAQRDGSPDAADGSLADLAGQLDLPLVGVLDAEQLVLDLKGLRELTEATALDGLVLVMIDGPIEASDGAAIARALRAGRSPLESELRAVAALEVRHDRGVRLEVRDLDHAAAFVAENFRHYLAALRDRPVDHFAAPEPTLIGRLLDRTGRMTVRPIETEVYSASIDVGVSTSSNGELRPADGSLIYDIPSNTWHGD
ncbi:MAG: hypothetical protein SYC29_02050, partial [Planctomycetota bacterium]|nr:hypothetical protein [Planctomycetota bacterium]